MRAPRTKEITPTNPAWRGYRKKVRRVDGFRLIFPMLPVTGKTRLIRLGMERGAAVQPMWQGCLLGCG